MKTIVNENETKDDLTRNDNSEKLCKNFVQKRIVEGKWSVWRSIKKKELMLIQLHRYNKDN